MSSIRIYITLLFFVSVITKGIAQDTINSTTVDQKSYQLYLDNNWTALIKYGNAAVSKGIDYFYLQMRIGIAYYEKKNYSLAEGHFKSALKFNSDNDLAQEYLYYCYIYNGRYEDARRLSKSFSKELSAKTGTDIQSSVGFIIIEAGSKKTDSISYYDVHRKTSSNYYKSPVYFQFGLNHYIKNRVSIFHAFTYFNQQTFLSHVSQIQYYFKTAIPIKNNWLISPSIHWINIKNTVDNKRHPSPPGQMGGAPQNNTTFTKSNYFVSSLTIQKIIKKYTIALGTTISNMNNITQYIHSGFISYAPLGNSKIVLGCTGYVHTIDNYSTTNIAASPFIYLQPVNRLSLKLSYLVNTKNNIIEDNGYIVNNSPDLTKSRLSALLNISLSKRVSLYGLYQLEYKYEGMQLFNYRYNVFVAGIKIIPK